MRLNELFNLSEEKRRKLVPVWIAGFRGAGKSVYRSDNKLDAKMIFYANGEEMEWPITAALDAAAGRKPFKLKHDGFGFPADFTGDWYKDGVRWGINVYNGIETNDNGWGARNGGLPYTDEFEKALLIIIKSDVAHQWDATAARNFIQMKYKDNFDDSIANLDVDKLEKDFVDDQAEMQDRFGKKAIDDTIIWQSGIQDGFISQAKKKHKNYKIIPSKSVTSIAKIIDFWKDREDRDSAFFDEAANASK